MSGHEAVVVNTCQVVPTVNHSVDVFDVLCHGPCNKLKSTKANRTNHQHANGADHTNGESRVTKSIPAYILILLNQPLDHFFLSLWKNATYRICADGATNRLFHHFKTDVERDRYLPHAVIGDLDSVRPAVLDYYSKHSESVYLRRDPDQDSTDLEKCINFFRQRLNDAAQYARSASATLPTNGTDVPACALPDESDYIRHADTGVEEWNSSVLTQQRSIFSPLITAASSSSAPLLVYPAFGGRFDQQMAHLHMAYKYALEQEQRQLALDPDANTESHPLILLGEGNCIRLLLPNRVHHLPIHPCLESGHHCGVWPLSADAHDCTTTGLKWNLTHAPMRWKEMISTSNILEPPISADGEVKLISPQSAPTPSAKSSRDSNHVVTIQSDVPMVFQTEVQHQHRFNEHHYDEEDQ